MSGADQHVKQLNQKNNESIGPRVINELAGLSAGNIHDIATNIMKLYIKCVTNTTQDTTNCKNTRINIIQQTINEQITDDELRGSLISAINLRLKEDDTKLIFAPSVTSSSTSSQAPARRRFLGLFGGKSKKSRKSRKSRRSKKSRRGRK
jgi:hypothetical protein